MNIEPYTPASVQYSDWQGTFAADEVDMCRVEEFLGVDREVWRLLHIGITIYGGSQTIESYAVSANTSYEDLQTTVRAGHPIQLTRLGSIEYESCDHSDTNPPPPMSQPVMSATEFLGYGFKRLELKMTSHHIPEGAKFEYIDLPDKNGSE